MISYPVIPPRQLMTQTSQGDPVFFHYYPLIGHIYRKRLENTWRLVKPYRFKRLIEVGYGSGIFLPSLSQITRKMWALDIHSKTKPVKKLLNHYGLRNVVLTIGDMRQMPFPTSFFDACVIISTLEDIEEAEHAIKELYRVVRFGGHLFVSFPIANVFTDTFFRLLGEDPTHMHPSNYRTIIASLKKSFEIKKILTYPENVPLPLTLYTSFHCQKTRRTLF